MDSAATRHLEREVKLKADLDLALPDLRGLVGGTFRLPELELVAAYFDTPDFRLWDQGVTLRHRTGEGPAPGTWTLKLPEEDGRRGEGLERSELSWEGSRDDLPPQASRLLQGLVRTAELGQVAELHTVRRPLELHDRDGRPWAVLDDDTVAVSGGPRDGLRFREVEVELTGGDGAGPDGSCEAGDALGAVVRVLQRAGARRDDSPKLATALGLPAAESATAAGTGVDRRSSLAMLVRTTIDAGLHRLLAHDVRLRVDRADPPVHDVHQARVATRRLRSDMKTFGPALDPAWTRHTRDELKWVGTALGQVRDLDVLAVGLDRPPAGGPLDEAGRRELAGHLAQQRRVACRQLADVLDDRRYLLLLDRLHAGATAPPFRAGRGPGLPSGGDVAPDAPARRAVRPLVGRAWRSLRRAARRAGSNPDSSELHGIRIKAKQLRYAAEATAPVIGRPAGRTARAAEAVQTVLGEHHDAVAAEEWLRNEEFRSTPQGSFCAGQLTMEMRRRAHELERRWRKDWKRLRRKKVVGWLR